VTEAATRAQLTFPVVEVFGPTVQGEGPLAGLPTNFIRFGYCDYRCSWCDSMYAVDPRLVRAEARRLTSASIVDELDSLDAGPSWVTLSGGNPAVHDLDRLVRDLHAHPWWIAVETQGSVWRDWLADVEMLVVSPKPPSSGMATRGRVDRTAEFLDVAEARVDQARRALKIVVFNEDDYVWARNLFAERPWPLSFLSVGTDQNLAHLPYLDAVTAIADRMAWLYERLARDDRMQPYVRALPQLHVLAWGTKRGV
jgi:7-carboxy-7-deazaguanine synthase